MATPAQASPKPAEYLYHTLNAVDAVQTINRGDAKELNPILGSNPSDEKVIAIKLAGSIIHYAASRALDDQPRKQKWFHRITVGLQGGVVISNFLVRF